MSVAPPRPSPGHGKGPSGPSHQSVSVTEHQLLQQAEQRGLWGRLSIYSRLSGPGWMQGAVTLGGGSLAGALFLGILAGPHLLWLQPLAMACGVVMLAAIAYVTLSTGERPVETMSRTLSPTLAIAWILATIMANLVFCISQFALATSTVTQNLIPVLSASQLAIWVVGLLLAVASLTIVYFYDHGPGGIRILEAVLKVMIGIVILAFFGVVISLAHAGQLDWRAALAGYVPDPRQLTEPTAALAAAAGATGEHAMTWRGIIADEQRNRIIAAFGQAVGINMTFLLPFTLLRRGWGKRHRGLATFDLSLGLFIPFVVATSFLVIAAWSQFYARTNDVFRSDGSVDPAMRAAYQSSVDQFLRRQHGEGFIVATAATQAHLRATLPAADRALAAMLAPRDARQLAATLEPFLGPRAAHLIFGVGVLAMALSTMIMLMVINGLAVSALVRRYEERRIFMLGAIMPAVTGLLAPVLWTGPSRAALAIPASVIGTTVLPIAYFAFLLLMNSRRALGDSRPSGTQRVMWNVLMVGATGAAVYASVWALMNQPGYWGHIGLLILGALAITGAISFFRNARPTPDVPRRA
jgi:Mn2+/Fe2+ NRAMP family transporter